MPGSARNNIESGLNMKYLNMEDVIYGQILSFDDSTNLEQLVS